MFGYVTPLKCELKIKEFDTYKALYCTLCTQLQHKFGCFSKIFLNYDFVFVYMLGLALTDTACSFKSCRCNTNPLKRCSMTDETAECTYAAAALSASACYKLKDDISDERFFRKCGAALLLPTANRAMKKARALYPEMTAAIAECCQKQTELERTQTPCLDAAADNSSLALAAVLEGLSDSADNKRILHRLGYLMGRFVYLADAADDLEKDIKKRRFNPLIPRFSLTADSLPTDLAKAKDFCRGELLLTQSEAADCYKQLKLKRFKSILDNIIYLGLPSAACKACKMKGTDNGQSL